MKLALLINDIKDRRLFFRNEYAPVALDERITKCIDRFTDSGRAFLGLLFLRYAPPNIFIFRSSSKAKPSCFSDLSLKLRFLSFMLAITFKFLFLKFHK
ncbi:MAG: hypothetical protein ABL927_05125 [Bdellovibrionales bacterium]